MSTIQELDAVLDEKIADYQRAKTAIVEVSLQLINAIAKEHAPAATKVVLDDSDQEGTEYVFLHFEDADGEQVVPEDEEAVDNLIWGPVSNLDVDDVLGHEIDLTG